MMILTHRSILSASSTKETMADPTATDWLEGLHGPLSSSYARKGTGEGWQELEPGRYEIEVWSSGHRIPMVNGMEGSDS